MRTSLLLKLFLLLNSLMLASCGGGSSNADSSQTTPVAQSPASPPQPINQTENFSTPIYTATEISIAQDIEYASRPNFQLLQYSSSERKDADMQSSMLRLTLDIYQPPNLTNQTLPLIVLLHAGDFVSGDKDDLFNDAMSFAQRGFVVASVNYRLTDQQFQRASVANRLLAISHASEDSMNAIRYLKHHALEYGINQNNIALLGKSAGGVIALLNAVDHDEFNNVINDFPGVSSAVQATITTGATFTEVLLNLVTFDQQNSPVMMFFAEDIDGLTGLSWQQHALATYNAMRDSGNTAYLIAQPSFSHMIDISPEGERWPMIHSFLAEHLQLDAD